MGHFSFLDYHEGNSQMDTAGCGTDPKGFACWKEKQNLYSEDILLNISEERDRWWLYIRFIW